MESCQNLPVTIKTMHIFSTVHTFLKRFISFSSRNANPLVYLSMISLFVLRTPKLSYWWDEWTVLESATNRPYWGLFTNHMGHFFPIGRLSFLLEVHLFRANYRFLLLINLVIALAICRQTVMALRRIELDSIHARFTLFLLMGLYVSSSGVIYDAQWGFQIAWFLSVYFALVVCNQLLNPIISKVWVIAAFLLCWLSLSSNLLLSVCLITSFLIGAPESLRIKRKLLIPTLALSGLILTLFGTIIASNNPPSDLSAVGFSLDPLFLFSNSLEIILLAIVMTTAWLLTPCLIVVTSGRFSFERFGDNLNAHRGVTVVLFFLLLLIAVWAFFLSKGKGAFSRFPLSLLLSVFCACGIIAAGRIGNFESYFHVRYAPVVGLMTVLFWISLIAIFRENALGAARLARISISTCLAVSCLFSLLVLPWTLSSTDFGRRAQDTDMWLIQLSKCQPQGNILVLRSIQPVMHGYQICNTAIKMKLLP